MKKFNLLSLLLLAICCTFTLISCDDDTFSGEVDMNFALTVDGDDFESGKTYTINGTAVEFANLGFYVGGITFDGVESQSIFEDKYLLVTPDNTSFAVGELSADTYDKVSFFIGVDAVTNAMSEEDFTTRASSDPLAAQDYAMHWNWNSGYKFFRIDGQSDTDGDGVVDTDVAYHIGTNALLGQLNFDLSKLEDNVEIEFDIAKLFADVDLSTEVNTMTGNNLPLAQQLVANYSTAFSVK